MSGFKIKRATTTPVKRNISAIHHARAYTIDALSELSEVVHAPKSNASLLCNEGLEAATTRCKETVARLSAECRARNQRYRDVEFDLLQDREICLHGLLDRDDIKYNPIGVKRCHEIFENPQFFVDGPNSSDIRQGGCGDCWYLSGLSTVAAIPDLIERLCPARDEKCGIYGFIFFRENTWVEVIIDDQLFTSVPVYEQLDTNNTILFKRDKELYSKVAGRGSSTLYFARSLTDNETWVPLIEKAYAKLHGDYAAISGGFASDAVEDLTGGLAIMAPVCDILDTDAYWNEELVKANKDRLFACFIRGFKKTLPPNPPKDNEGNIIPPADVEEVEGINTGHSYGIIKAIEYKGKRFLKIRNPWARGEWKGPWSDGSKEWTAEWVGALEALDYSFGDDGEFIMEYSDFLRVWQWVDRCRVFDNDWYLAQEWLDSKTRPFPSAWTYGDISFTIDIATTTEAVICLSSTDVRYYYGLEGHVKEAFDFTVFKAGSKHPLVSSPKTQPQERSTKVEVMLEPGRYVVHVRIDRYMFRNKDYLEQSNYSYRKFARVYKTGTLVAMTARNFAYDDIPAHLRPVDVATGYTIPELEEQALAAMRAAGISDQQLSQAAAEETEHAQDFHMPGKPRVDMPPSIADDPAPEETKREPLLLSPPSPMANNGDVVASPTADGPAPELPLPPAVQSEQPQPVVEEHAQENQGGEGGGEGEGGAEQHQEQQVEEHQPEQQQTEAAEPALPESASDEEITITFGLRVYSHDKSARVEGQLRKGELPWSK